MRRLDPRVQLVSVGVTEDSRHENNDSKSVNSRLCSEKKAVTILWGIEITQRGRRSVTGAVTAI